MNSLRHEERHHQQHPIGSPSSLYKVGGDDDDGNHVLTSIKQVKQNLDINPSSFISNIDDKSFSTHDTNKFNNCQKKNDNSMRMDRIIQGDRRNPKNRTQSSDVPWQPEREQREQQQLRPKHLQQQRQQQQVLKCPPSPSTTTVDETATRTSVSRSEKVRNQRDPPIPQLQVKPPATEHGEIKYRFRSNHSMNESNSVSGIYSSASSSASSNGKHYSTNSPLQRGSIIHRTSTEDSNATSSSASSTELPKYQSKRYWLHSKLEIGMSELIAHDRFAGTIECRNDVSFCVYEGTRGSGSCANSFTSRNSNSTNGSSNVGGATSTSHASSSSSSHFGCLLPKAIANKLTHYREKECCILFHEIVQCVRILHQNHMVHRNLHLDNIVMSKTGDIRLRGLRYAVAFSNNDDDDDHNNTNRSDEPQEHESRFSGYRHNWYAFRAPETDNCFNDDNIIDIDNNVNLRMSPSIDVWSLGTILYVLLTGVPPFRGSGKQLHHQKHRGEVEFDMITPSKEAQDLVRRMLNVNSWERPTIDEIILSDWFDKMMSPVDNDAICNTDLSLVQILFQDWKIIPNNVSSARTTTTARKISAKTKNDDIVPKRSLLLADNLQPFNNYLSARMEI